MRGRTLQEIATSGVALLAMTLYIVIPLKPKACIFGGIAQSATPPASKDNIFRLTPYPHKKTLRHALTSSPPSNKKKPASPGRNGSSVI